MNYQATEENIQEVAQKIARKFKPEKIILFGQWFVNCVWLTRYYKVWYK